METKYVIGGVVIAAGIAYIAVRSSATETDQPAPESSQISYPISGGQSLPVASGSSGGTSGLDLSGIATMISSSAATQAALAETVASMTKDVASEQIAATSQADVAAVQGTIISSLLPSSGLATGEGLHFDFDSAGRITGVSRAKEAATLPGSYQVRTAEGLQTFVSKTGLTQYAKLGGDALNVESFTTQNAWSKGTTQEVIKSSSTGTGAASTATGATAGAATTGFAVPMAAAKAA